MALFEGGTHPVLKRTDLLIGERAVRFLIKKSEGQATLALRNVFTGELIEKTHFRERRGRGFFHGFFQSLNRDFERFRQAYSWLSEAQLRAALGYYAAYPDEIDRRIALNERWTREHVVAQHPSLTVDRA